MTESDNVNFGESLCACDAKSNSVQSVVFKVLSVDPNLLQRGGYFRERGVEFKPIVSVRFVAISNEKTIPWAVAAQKFFNRRNNSKWLTDGSSYKGHYYPLVWLSNVFVPKNSSFLVNLLA